MVEQLGHRACLYIRCVRQARFLLLLQLLHDVSHSEALLYS